MVYKNGVWALLFYTFLLLQGFRPSNIGTIWMSAYSSIRGLYRWRPSGKVIKRTTMRLFVNPKKNQRRMCVLRASKGRRWWLYSVRCARKARFVCASTGV